MESGGETVEAKTPSDVPNLDLDLAWKRIKKDRPDRCFINHPYLLELIELDLKDWLHQLRHAIDGGTIPTNCRHCFVPKSSWLVRPGAILTIQDEVYYTALVGASYHKIFEKIGHLQGKTDIAYQIRKFSLLIDWIYSGFQIWTEWRTKSLAAITKQVRYVVTADIAGYYENIDLGRLFSDLQSIGVHPAIARQISNCLNRWAQPRGKGIPQGYSASDILAKLYLEPVDSGSVLSG